MLIESVAQSLIAKLVARYISRHHPSFSPFIDSGLKIYATYQYCDAFGMILFAEMRSDGVSDLSNLIVGDVVAKEIHQIIPEGASDFIEIHSGSGRMIVESGFIPGFDLEKYPRDNYSLSGPHPALGLRYDRVDLRVLEYVFDKQVSLGRSPVQSQFAPHLLGAARSGNMDDVELAIFSGSPIEGEGGRINLSSPLASAAFRGHVDIVKLLLALGAHPDSPKSPQRPLVAAYEGNNPDIVALLLGEGASPSYGGRESLNSVRNSHRKQNKIWPF